MARVDQGFKGGCMRRHVLASIAVVIAGGVLVVAQPAAPRSTSGQADLQGTWNFSTITPLERPAEFAGKEFLTEAEAAAYEARTVQRNNRDTRESSADADVASAYNEFWWDRGVHAARVHGRVRTSLIVDPPDGKIPALTADAQQRAAARADARRQHPADGPEDRSLGERCLLFNAGPPMLSGPYNNYVQILQTPDSVVILNEMIHDSRIVPLDGRPHLPSAVRRMLGDSRGHWDGHTLVVETTNFSDKTNVRSGSTTSSEVWFPCRPGSEAATAISFEEGISGWSSSRARRTRLRRRPSFRLISPPCSSRTATPKPSRGSTRPWRRSRERCSA